MLMVQPACSVHVYTLVVGRIYLDAEHVRLARECPSRRVAFVELARVSPIPDDVLDAVYRTLLESQGTHGAPSGLPAPARLSEILKTIGHRHEADGVSCSSARAERAWNAHPESSRPVDAGSVLSVTHGSLGARLVRLCGQAHEALRPIMIQNAMHAPDGAEVYGSFSRVFGSWGGPRSLSSAFEDAPHNTSLRPCMSPDAQRGIEELVARALSEPSAFGRIPDVTLEQIPRRIYERCTPA